MAHSTKKLSTLLASLALLASCSSPHPGDGTPNPGSNLPPPKPGQTDFTTEEATGNNGAPGRGGVADQNAGKGGGFTSGGPAPAAPGEAAPPAGRMADVEEGDIYKVDNNRLFYLNTYRGFLIYDVNDATKPKRLGRLPVFGYPIEMFVSGNTVYALLRDALYLTQVNGKLQFQRHNVSQLVTIDITDLSNPKVLKTIDIVGELREGVSRKIENTIYVVSYIPQSYYWGWRPDPMTQPKEQAWVYSFNVANPQDTRKVGELQIFEGGSVNIDDGKGNYYNRNFSSVSISATANALMVVENWNIWASSNPTTKGGSTPSYGCGSYSSNEIARVSLIDISDPTGVIQLHARFETTGMLNDQFKMTYVNDPVAKTGTFYGIFARQVWGSVGCQGTSFTQNTIESWDVSVRGQPKKLDALDFGKKNELVRGSAFDVERHVAYAITAQRTDPLYAINLADRANLSILSQIDGLSGDMTVFRLVAGSKFLLAVGQDTSTACTGFDPNAGWAATKIAVSLIDVQDLAKIRLVQRQCVAVKNADWIGSDVTNNLDQAHKMLGMHADGTLNVITVPIYYSKRVDSPQDWWWYRQETAVGLMTWDLSKYDSTKSELQQSVIQNYGTFVHPHGEVRRSIVFTHQGATPQRMMINLSDTHISIANIQDMANPVLQSEIEVAPYYNQIYAFGDYLVEQVQSKPSWYGGGQDVSTFRVKKAGGTLDDATPIASFDIGQVYRVLKHNQSLVLFRQSQAAKTGPNGQYVPPTTEALIVDLKDPSKPRLAGKVALPAAAVPYYRYWCGMGMYWGGFWFDDVASFAMTDRGFAFYISEWKYENNVSSQTNKLQFLDVRNPDAPTISETPLPTTYEWGAFGMVADPIAPSGFYVSYRKPVGTVKTTDGGSYTRYRYYAQRWDVVGDNWVASQDINTPGRLVRTWKSGAGERMFLSQDTSYRIVTEGMNKRWLYDYRLSLLHQVMVAGRPAAELLDAKVLTDLYPSALLVEGDKIFMNAQQQRNYWYGFGGGGDVAVGASDGVSTSTPLPSWESSSDRLTIFDLSKNKLDTAYDQPTGMYNVQLMGVHQGKLFVNLAGGGQYYAYDGYGYGGGDGILVVDVTNPRAPTGSRFLRTLGYATHIEFFGSDVYIASGFFGLSHLGLADPPELPPETN